MINRRYVIALVIAFIIGCVAALALRSYDVRKDTPEPIEAAQVFDISAGGFTLSAPHELQLTEYYSPEGMLFSGMLSDGEQTLLLFSYTNDHSDTIDHYTDQALVTYYMNAGCSNVRMRTLGNRRFVCYSAQIQAEDGAQTWHVYETWDVATRLLIETQMSDDEALPILTTLSFTAPANP